MPIISVDKITCVEIKKFKIRNSLTLMEKGFGCCLNKKIIN